ncbi:hypothetical protein DMH15_16890 [Streptomyces sp. WAC 06725]|nr:hypothetical protein DMH15_16890 [Streptomyces sp. WAC 06725]
MPVDGVSTYLALTFGTLLSSQGTDASFGPVSPGPPGASLRSCVSDSIRSVFRSGLPILEAAGSNVEPIPLRRGVVRAFRRDHYFSGFSR